MIDIQLQRRIERAHNLLKKCVSETELSKMDPDTQYHLTEAHRHLQLWKVKRSQKATRS